MTHRIPTSSVLALLLALLASAGTNAAVIATFDSRANFDAAVGATTAEDFESIGSDTTFHTTSVDVGPFTLSMTGTPGTSPGNNVIDVPPFQNGSLAVNSTTFASAFTALGDSLLLTFDTPIYAFGADFNQFNDQVPRTEILVDGETISPTVDGSVRFFGLQTDSAFSVIEFQGLDNDTFGFDDVAFTSVPEPTAAVLIGLGLSVFACMRRR